MILWLLVVKWFNSVSHSVWKITWRCCLVSAWSKGVSCVIDLHGLSAPSFVTGRVQSRLLKCLLHLLSFNSPGKKLSKGFFPVSVFERSVARFILTGGWWKRCRRGGVQWGEAFKWRGRNEASCCFVGVGGTSDKWWFALSGALREDFAQRLVVGSLLSHFEEHFWVLAF